ncbi:MAG: metallophosphoesterase [Chloroflexi bacterium]|nr:metallophosphoesterase [Chloroflexota bacterium]
MMRLACISDIHGNLTALEAALADLEAIGGADHLWILGDLAAMGSRPVECIRRVKGLVDAVKDDEHKKDTVRVISGNTDRYLVTGTRMTIGKTPENQEELDAARKGAETGWKVIMWGLNQLEYDDYAFLAKLPGECDLYVPGYGHVIGYHAVPGDDEGYLLPATSDEEAADFLLDREGRLGIGGHIHQQFDRTLAGRGWRVINDGAVGLSFEKPGLAQWALITFDGGEAQVDLREVPYDVEAAVADAQAVGHPAPEWLENLMRNGRK